MSKIERRNRTDGSTMILVETPQKLKQVADWVENVMETPDAEAERFILDITEKLCRLMQRNKVDYKELAKRTGYSERFIKEWFGGGHKEIPMKVKEVAIFFHALGYKVQLTIKPDYNQRKA